MLLLLCCKDS